LTQRLQQGLKAWSPRLRAFCIMGAFLALTMLATTANLRLTYIDDSDGVARVALTTAEDVDTLLYQTGFSTEEEDAVYYTAYGGNLARLNIQRAFAITIQVDGEEQQVKLLGGTVAEALEAAGIELGEHDYTTPGLHSLVFVGQTIEVHRVSYEQTVEYETIPCETQYIYTSLYYRNQSRTTTVQEGSDGQRAVTSQQRWVDGVLESTEVVDTTNTIEPQHTVIKAYGEGAPVSPLTGPDGTTNAPTTYKKVLTGKATGYSSSGGRGASGLGLGYGTVAVDPSVIPYGTLLYIASTDGKFVYGYAIATDTGTALLNGTVLVDLYYETRAESIINGAMTVNVYVVG
jgi:3D (Asp-Asp-Asp) domain-containing protein